MVVVIAVFLQSHKSLLQRSLVDHQRPTKNKTNTR